MLEGWVAMEVVFLVIGLLIVLAAIGGGVWIWLRRRPFKQDEKPEVKA